VVIDSGIDAKAWLPLGLSADVTVTVK
jgi:hypothetical protein